MGPGVMSLRSCLIRVLIVTTMKVAVVGSILFINTVTAETVRGEFDECFNPHTGQVFVADDVRCTENPYATTPKS